MAAPRGHVWFKFDRPLALRSFLGRAWQHSAIGMRLMIFVNVSSARKIFRNETKRKRVARKRALHFGFFAMHSFFGLIFGTARRSHFCALCCYT